MNKKMINQLSKDLSEHITSYIKLKESSYSIGELIHGALCALNEVVVRMAVAAFRGQSASAKLSPDDVFFMFRDLLIRQLSTTTISLDGDNIIIKDKRDKND